MVTPSGRIFPPLAAALAVAALLLAAPAAAQTAREGQLLHRIGERMRIQAARDADPIVAAADRHDVQALLALFRRADGDESRRRIADALHKLGGEAPSRLLRLLETELNAALRDYRRAFATEVAAAVRRLRQGEVAAEIDRHQGDILALQRDPGLTKDMIVRIADPAVQRLAELLTMDRDTILAGSPRLRAARDTLITLAQLGQTTAKRVPAAERRAARAAAGALPIAAARPANAADRLPAPAQLEQELSETEAALAMSATPMPEDALDVLMENRRIAAGLDPLEAELIEALNLLRLRAGMSPLAIDVNLSDAARDHGQDMVTLNFFAHTSPVPGKTTPWDRARNFGTSASGENIFHGSASPAAALKAWWYSPGHHQNMMNPRFRRIGVGRYHRHWTQMFGS